MTGREIVRKAIEFDLPPRIPFFVGSAWMDRLSVSIEDFPNDVWDCWEMDRQEAGWYFDNPDPDDWGCQWMRTEIDNMGQVVSHPLGDWANLSSYTPPNPRNPFYFARIEKSLREAEDRYVVITSHFNLIERLEMLHGFSRTHEDFYLEPEKIHKVLDMILEYKIDHFAEAFRQFGDRVHGIFLTDDWGTQQNTFVSRDIFKEFFLDRYRNLFDAVHADGWHAILHSCGRINDFVQLFIDAGVDVMNMQQPRTYGIEKLGESFAGKICFLSTVDIQATLPRGNAASVCDEAALLVENWSTPRGGFIVFNYGDSGAIGTTDEMTETMFRKFYELRYFWHTEQAKPSR